MLPDHERFRFHFGPYTQPVYAFGDIVECSARGEVTIIRQSDGRILWPVGFPVGTGGNRGRGTLILFDGLKLAIENESSQAVKYWFGVSVHTIAKWRWAHSQWHSVWVLYDIWFIILSLRLHELC
jgi:hypothetical protein